MGVKGLTAFIDDNPSLLQDYKLYNCRVLIDGNNLIHLVYNRYNSGFQYDGDYFNYCKKIEHIFMNLKMCRIQPYVILDGGYDVSDSKLRTLKIRAEKRVKQALNQNSLFPVLGNKAFIKTLDRLGIPHVNCDFEADEEIAILANIWHCPVISNDSDFFVYNLKAGFLPLNYVDFRPVKSEQKHHYLRTQRYHFDHYKEILENFHPELIPLLATVLGNDFIKQDTFLTFTEKFEKPKYKLKYASKTVSKITAIINHFDQFKTFEEGRVAITKHFQNSGGMASLQNVIDTSIKSYTKIDTQETCLVDFFCGGMQYSSINRKDFFGQNIPEFLIKGLFEGHISPNVQNIAVLHRIILPCQQEDDNQPSSHKISLRIRQVIYGIMFQDIAQEMTSNKKKVKVTKASHVEEIIRTGRSVGSVFVDPRVDFVDYGKMPSTSGIPSVTLERRRKLVLKSLGVPEEFVSNFHPSLQLLMAVINYWVYYSEASKQELESLILTILILKIKTLIKDKTSDERSTNHKSRFNLIVKLINVWLYFWTWCMSLVRRGVINIDAVLGSFQTSDLTTINFSLPTGGRRILSKQIVHLYSEYQSCLLCTLLLNELLQFPFIEPDLREIYDGQYVHHFNSCIKRELSLPEVNILKMIERHPKLVVLYKSITDIVMTSVNKRPRKHSKLRKKATPSRYYNSVKCLLVSMVMTAVLVLLAHFYFPLMSIGISLQ